MKKTIIRIVVVLAVVIVLWIIMRRTGALQWYAVATGSNEPTYHIGDVFFTSRLKAPKRLDFISFYYNDPNHKWSGIRVYRLLGITGDKVEIRNGTVYVNDSNMDAHLHLKHLYFVSKNKANNIDMPNVDIVNSNDSTIMFFMNDSDAVKAPAISRYLPLKYKDEYIMAMYHKDWTADNFGPVTVPANSYFLLGDNRNNALDSRYIGFVSKDDFVGTVLRK